MQGLRGAEWSLDASGTKLITISRKIGYLLEQVDANKTANVLDRSKRLVNVVNVVNVGEHVMS
jgi:hypothetical protein